MDNLSRLNYQLIFDHSAEQLFVKVAERVVAAVLHAWREGREAQLVITGGRSGLAMAQAIDLALFRATAQDGAELFSNAKIRIWMSDERFVPFESDDRSDATLIAAFTKSADHLVFERIAAPDQGTLVQAAASYAESLDARLGELARFDAVLLSLGEDGHVASLFPGHSEQLDSGASAISVGNSPKPPAARVSMGIAQLARASAIYIFALGESKREAVAVVLAGDEISPVARLRQCSPVTQIFFVTDFKV